MTQLYPVGLRLDGLPVLVVGGGAVATRRVPALLAAGAIVTIVSPTVTTLLRGLVDAGRVNLCQRRFVPSDVDGCWLVHAAVDDPEAAQEISDAARHRRVLCVRADDRHAATAWTPAVARSGPVTVAVMADGNPRRAVRLRDTIHEHLVSGALDAGSPQEPPRGVALIGAGPGDPELITVRGRRLLAQAEVVVVDRLAPGVLLDELRPEVEVIDASKIPYGPSQTQDEINRMMIDRARSGRFVARLKGGDPFVFGRGGEEVLACVFAGVPVIVVPGVTSAIAAPSSVGIPVTHRGIAQEFTVVSGHVPPGHPESLVDWAVLGRLQGTLCVLMGLKNLEPIVDALMEAGRLPQTPVALVQDATTQAQRMVRGTLGTIVAVARKAGFCPPGVIVVGAVVDVLSPTLTVSEEKR